MATTAPQPVTATDEERDTLAALADLLAQGRSVEAQLIGPDGAPILLPASVVRVLAQAIPALAEGNAVTVLPVHRELTTQEAADLLNVSRQYLVRLLDQVAIPHSRPARTGASASATSWPTSGGATWRAGRGCGSSRG